MNIYVGNLAYSVTEQELREVFEAFGEVVRADLIMDKYSGRSKGFGFIEMPCNSSANNAVKALNSSDLQGRTIKVNQARPRGNGTRFHRAPRY